MRGFYAIRAIGAYDPSMAAALALVLANAFGQVAGW